MKVAILLTCYNRMAKTETCLNTLLQGMKAYIYYNIFLVDDNSSDGTTEMVRNKYPQVNIIHGTGSLFWAGGMRLAWQTAINSSIEYDGFLLINDDVEFIDSFWSHIIFTDEWCKSHYNRDGIYVSSVKDKETGSFTYGGHILKKKLFKNQTVPVYPSTDVPVACQLTNANILYVSADVMRNIGILDANFTHSLADFDYTLMASERNIPVLVCPDYGGYCHDDHLNLSASEPLKKRIKHLYNAKGLALNEYLYYLKKHFWWKVPYAFLALWADTLFPKRKHLK